MNYTIEEHIHMLGMSILTFQNILLTEARVGACPKAIENTDPQATNLSDIIGSYDGCWRQGLRKIAKSFTNDSWRIYR